MESDVEFNYKWFNRDVSSAYDYINDIRNRDLRRRIRERAAFDVCYYLGRVMHHLENLTDTVYREEVDKKFTKLLSSISRVKREFPSLMDDALLAELDNRITKMDEIYNDFFFAVRRDDFDPKDEDIDWYLGLRTKVEFSLRGMRRVNEGVDIDYSSIINKLGVIDEILRDKLADVAKFYVKKEHKKYYRSRIQNFWWYSLMFSEM